MCVKAPMHINSHTKFQLGFSKFQFFNGQEGGTAPLCQIVLKSLQPLPRYSDFSIFQDGGRRRLGLSKFEIFNGHSQEGRTASPCQFSSKSFEPRPRYASFSIMLVWLENAYSRPFGVFGHIPPNDVTSRPNPKMDHPWAKPRHLSHKPRIFSY